MAQDNSLKRGLDEISLVSLFLIRVPLYGVALYGLWQGFFPESSTRSDTERAVYIASFGALLALLAIWGTVARLLSSPRPGAPSMPIGEGAVSPSAVDRSGSDAPSDHAPRRDTLGE